MNNSVRKTQLCKNKSNIKLMLIICTIINDNIKCHNLTKQDSEEPKYEKKNKIRNK